MIRLPVPLFAAAVVLGGSITLAPSDILTVRFSDGRAVTLAFDSPADCAVGGRAVMQGWWRFSEERELPAGASCAPR